MGFYQEALAIKNTIIQDRRYLHQNPETGLDLPLTTAYVESRLKEMGYRPRRLSGGIVAEIGTGDGPCVLLRADMDGLPVTEEAKVVCRSRNGRMHACGHDCHTAMLLGAARLLKNHEGELTGLVRLMFQPGEETMEGGRAMVEGGVLDHPRVVAALGLHVYTGVPIPSGSLVLNGENCRSAAVDWFTIYVEGKGCHGAMPDQGTDPLNVLCHIYLALQTINSREIAPGQPMVLTIGKMEGGSIANVIPQKAAMSGTIRSLTNENRAFIKERMAEISASVAAAFRGNARVEFGAGCPVLTQDRTLYHRTAEICRRLEGISLVDLDELDFDSGSMGSEDFAYVSGAVPSVFLGLGAGNSADGALYPQHHPMAVFDEDALPTGTAAYAHIAYQWLKEL